MIKQVLGYKTYKEMPREAGKIVGMLEWQGRHLIACENGMYVLWEDGLLKPLEFHMAEPSLKVVE